MRAIRPRRWPAFGWMYSIHEIESGLRRQDPPRLRQRGRRAGARRAEARRHLRPARAHGFRGRSRRRDPRGARGRAFLALGSRGCSQRVDQGPKSRRPDDPRVPEPAERVPAVPARPRRLRRPRPRGPAHHVGVLRRPGLARPADGPPLGLHAAQPRASNGRSGPRRHPPGAGAVQAARAARYADCRSQEMIREEYLKWYYDTGVWKHLSYRGVRTLKLPLDMWNYQEIIAEHGIEWVLETGTRHGGSALFFADLLAARGAAGFVISVDVDHASLQISAHP